MGANFKKREHFYKKQFTLPVMFSIPIAITEEICLSNSLLPRNPSPPPALQRNPNLVFVSSVCFHGNCHKRIVTSQQDGKGRKCALRGSIKNDHQKQIKTSSPGGCNKT